METSTEISGNINNYLLLFVYLIPVGVIWCARNIFRRKASKRHANMLQENLEAGLTEPASLHPIVDRDLCIGCNACSKACPEGDVLAIIHDKVEGWFWGRHCSICWP